MEVNALELTEFEEGYREDAYYCSEDYPTIGIGWRIGDKHQNLDDFKHIKISREMAFLKLSETVGNDYEFLKRNLPSFSSLNDQRKAVLLSMSYQLGLTGLLKFKNMLAAIEAKDWDKAYQEGLNSRWAKQTPKRAERQMMTLRLGDWSQYA